LLQSAIDNANFLSTEKGWMSILTNLYVKHAVANDGPAHEADSSGAMGAAYHTYGALRI